MIDPALNIENYAADGFVKVCEVYDEMWNGGPIWWYTDINESVMFSEHRSWVYFIVLDQEIVKIGETGNPLGVRSKTSDQPLAGSTGRLGRYRNGDGTDFWIRHHLKKDLDAGRKVTIWARRCEMVKLSVSVGGIEDETMTTFHKDLELKYLDRVFSQTGDFPCLNKSRK